MLTPARGLKLPKEISCNFCTASLGDVVPQAAQMRLLGRLVKGPETLLATVNDVAEIALKIFLGVKLGEVSAFDGTKSLQYRFLHIVGIYNHRLLSNHIFLFQPPKSLPHQLARVGIPDIA
jgi:hypothetical protein